MKFAVVEYTSKSGGVWRHSDVRPNYLADPRTEIDPTSFGCYVSALKGEHVPLTGLIIGPTAAVATPTTFYRKVIKRLTGSWPQYSLEYLRQFDVVMMVHQLSDAHEVVAAINRLKTLPNAPFIIGVPTQPYGQLQTAIAKDPSVKQHLRDFIRQCDLFISVVEETTAWYEELAQTSVTYLPQPYPTAFANQNFLPREKKLKQILVAGVTQRDNIKQGQIVASQLQKKWPDYEILVPKVDEYDYDSTNFGGAKFTILPFQSWREHLRTLATTTLVINTDYTLTRGRVQTDCAAVGTPSLGGNSDGTRDLFPELRSNPTTSIDQLIALGDRLLTDHDYYTSITTYASEHLKKYDYEESAARLQLLVKSHQQR